MQTFGNIQNKSSLTLVLENTNTKTLNVVDKSPNSKKFMNQDGSFSVTEVGIFLLKL